MCVLLQRNGQDELDDRSIEKWVGDIRGADRSMLRHRDSAQCVLELTEQKAPARQGVQDILRGEHRVLQLPVVLIDERPVEPRTEPALELLVLTLIAPIEHG